MIDAIETERLSLRAMRETDAPFIFELQNDPGWLRYIGDRGIRTIDDALHYIRTGPQDMYARLGYGFRVVELRDSRTPIGICGIAKRPYLDDPDVGFALLPDFAGCGYAFEAAHAVLADARESLGLKRIVATTRPDNHRSASLLRKLGLSHQRQFLHPDGDRPLDLYAIDFA